MARRRRSHRSIPDAFFKRAIEWLEDGGTKVGACRILSESGEDVKSNTTMERMIEEWKSEQETQKIMRAKKRGTIIDGFEAKSIIEDYLTGSPLSEIANRQYRSENMIKTFLIEAGAFMLDNEPEDPMFPHKIFPPLMPEELVADSFEIGEIVYVAGYKCYGEIMAKHSDSVYRVYLLSDRYQMNTYQDVANLGSIRQLKEKYNVDPTILGIRYTKEETQEILHNTILAAKTRSREKK